MSKRGGTTLGSEELLTGQIYHVYNRILQGEGVFNEISHGHPYAHHFIQLLKHCLYFSSSFSIHKRVDESFSKLFRLTEPSSNPGGLNASVRRHIPVRVHAYTVMPNHFHLVLEQLVDNGISYYVGRVLNSFTKIYNIESSRIGPLWQSRFKATYIDSSEAYLQVMRYVHLNPVKSSRLNVNKPSNYPFSSYKETIGLPSGTGFCHLEFLNSLIGGPEKYELFVNAPISSGEQTLSNSLSIEKDHNDDEG